MKRIACDEAGLAHFITFSCYKRRRLLDTPQARGIVLHWLDRQLFRNEGECAGFVIMPDHVHAIIRFQRIGQFSGFMQQWKRLSSHGLRDFLCGNKESYRHLLNDSDPVWQAHFYDFPVLVRDKMEEKLMYMHHNPVRAGLTDAPVDWRHSSARWYETGVDVGVRLVGFL